ALFRQLQCARCHQTDQTVGAFPPLPELEGLVFHPYTDLLLHDMGPGLADPAGPEKAEWRTPPLWGIGLTSAVNGHTRFLHDGRARNPAEAILWHGGEAEASREAFRHLDARERQALLQFLESL
ncbi:MAG: di-heme oxidoredictase family protein, partial [Verrucomicrobiota bacterium]